MKRNSLKIAGLIIALALVISCVIGFGASAEDAKLEIYTANVAYNDMMHLAFTLTGTEALPDGAEAGIIIWDSEKTEYTAANASYKTFNAGVDGDTTYYKSEGIAAPKIGAEIYVAACYKLDGAVTITETPFKYSIVDYLTKRLSENVTEVQAELYANVLTYGAASDTVLSENSFVLVKTVGGYVGSYNRAALAAKEVGESFTLRAPITNENGDYFAKWIDKSGETVSTDRVCIVTPETAGISLYTAVYGGEASYKSGFGFEDFETGELPFPTPDLTKLPTTTCYNSYSGTNMVRWGIKHTGTNYSIQFYALPLATVTGQTDAGKNIYEFTTDENGNYIVGMKDSAVITEKADGNKEMSYVRGIKGAAGYESTYRNTATGCNTAEIDLGYDTKLTGNGVQNHIDIYVYDGSAGATYRFNIFAEYAKSQAYIYGEQSTSGSRAENQVKTGDTIPYFSLNPGERATVSVTLNTSGDAPCFDFYYNGAYAGSLACSILKGHNASIDFTKAYVNTLSVKAVSAVYSTITFDNICFK